MRRGNRARLLNPGAVLLLVGTLPSRPTCCLFQTDQQMLGGSGDISQQADTFFYVCKIIKRTKKIWISTLEFGSL